jgi:hypothetical protein
MAERKNIGHVFCLFVSFAGERGGWEKWIPK